MAQDDITNAAFQRTTFTFAAKINVWLDNGC